MRTLKKYWPLFLFTLIISLSIFFRVVNLHADPPTEHFLEAGDEGTHSYATRQLYLTGNWAPDGVYFGGVMPVYPLLQIGGVILFGVHNYAFRAVNVLTSILTTLIIFWFIKKEWGIIPALVNLSSLGLSFFFTLYSKTGLPEATMVLFSTCAFIAYYYSLIIKKQHFFFGVITGLFMLFAFFTKQSSVTLVSLITITWILYYIRELRKTKNIGNKYIQLAIGIAIVSGVFLVLYTVICIVPTLDKWTKNIPAIIGGNHPRQALLQIPYLVEQIRLTLVSPLWTYLHIVTVGTIISLLAILTRLKRQNQGNRGVLENLVVAWLFIFIIYMTIIPLKGARFFILIIIPMTLLYVSLFKKEQLLFFKRKVGMVFVALLMILPILELAINVGYNYWYFVKDAQFQVLESTKKLAQYVPRDRLGNLPVHWIMNDTFRDINTFLVPVSDRDIQNYYDQYGWPEFMVILNQQIGLYQTQSPLFFKQLRYVTVINGYTLYKVKHT